MAADPCPGPAPGVLPAGALAVGHRLRAEALALATGETVAPQVDLDPVLAHELLLPLRVEPDWPGPMAPQRVGTGWVQADLTDDDLDTFDRLRSLHPDAGPEELATMAQEWRLPVLPYRYSGYRVPPAAFGADAGTRSDSVPARRPACGLKVLDLSSLWAGPFATALLADHGATVVKVDPDCRPDGFRERPQLYAHLNGHKEIVDLDLRVGSDRGRFEQLVRWADVLVTSFSRRVLPNLGYDAPAIGRLNPKLATVSIVGFPRGVREADWLAYGSGIHAICGLGIDARSGTAKATAVAYPDPLTGYRASIAALICAGSGAHVEVTLADAGVLVALEETAS